MRITLRSLVLALAVLATAAFTTQTASAATATVRVPFNFNVNGKTLPAGKYFVTRDLNTSLVTLKSEDCKDAYSWIGLTGAETHGDPRVTLRFDESDGKFALREIQYNTLITGRLDKHFSERSTLREVVGSGF